MSRTRILPRIFQNLSALMYEILKLNDISLLALSELLRFLGTNMRERERESKNVVLVRSIGSEVLSRK